MPETDFKLLESVPQMVAEMWRELLGDAGIVALIRPSDAFVMLGAGQLCQVLVPANRLEEARALVDELEQEPWVDGPDSEAD